MANEDESVVVCFNGEIYRFWELRRDLEELGHRFRSKCDTEVILRAYEQWGRGLLDRIDGMFAFGIWDARRRALLLARDRLGKKPLFWAARGGALGFSSMIRPLVACGLARPEMTLGKLREFLYFNYVIGPETIFRDVALLPAGSWLCHRGGRIERGRYWDLGESRPEEDVIDLQGEFEARLREATRVRMVSDAPLGIFLSGGVDSSVVAALAQRETQQPIRTFTIGFEEASYDERPKARRVVERLDTDHSEIPLRAADVPSAASALTASADHLLADQSMIPLAKLAKEAKREVKVVLTGDGGDELLAGYATYRALNIARTYTRFVPARLRAVLSHFRDLLPASQDKMSASQLLQRFLAATTGDLARAHASWRTIWTHPEIDALLGGRATEAQEWRTYADYLQRNASWSLLQSAVYADVKTWLVDSILAKVDRATMATGLEARSPLLDSRLMEFAFSTLLRDPRNASKAPLRHLASSLLGPDLAATPKEGFQTPFATWFAGPLRPYVQQSLAALREALPGVFDAKVMQRVEDDHASGRRNHDLKLWSLIALTEWAKLYPGICVANGPTILRG
jgi:asparagine synthase (glutamine-hydrolysing)